MEFKEYRAKTVEDATIEAAADLGVESDKLEIEIVERGSSGFLGIGSKPAIINARVKEEGIVETTRAYLDTLFKAMDMEVNVIIEFDEEKSEMDIDLEGPEMGILIGKRGQTLDSLQYLTSLFVNKKKDKYIKVKMDTENYRARRKETLENLAKNLAYKAKRTKHPVSLEPMNPYERRIIHSALQNDKYVTTHSEGEDPFRKVIITPVK